jgi:hypothetical protein
MATPERVDEVLEGLRELNEPVPRPLRLPSEAEVASVEKELDVLLHPDYRRFLLEASDVVLGTLEPATITPDSGHTYLVPLAREAWDAGAPRDWIPIGEDNGDYYCMDGQGQVRCWSRKWGG